MVWYGMYVCMYVCIYIYMYVCKTELLIPDGLKVSLSQFLHDLYPRPRRWRWKAQFSDLGTQSALSNID